MRARRLRFPDRRRWARSTRSSGRAGRRLSGWLLGAGRRLGQWYGAGPWQALAMAFCFALAGYAAVRLLTGRTVAVAVWFAGGALLHDLVLLPLYSGADRLARPRTAGKPTHPPAVDHLRVPVFLSGVLFLVWFPLILNRSPSYPGASGLSEDVYLGRWLVITGVLFALSALTYVLRRASRRRRGHR